MKCLNQKKYKHYWIARGYSEEDAVKKSYEYHSGHVEYWLKRGLTEEQAKKKIAEQSADNVEYWMAQGYPEAESREYADVYSAYKTYNKKLYNFKHVEYWIAQGCSKEEALEKIKYYLLKNKKRPEYWIAQGYSEADARKKLKENNPTCKLYWTARGYSEKEAITEIRKLNEKYPEYWIQRGYTEDDARLKAAQVTDSANIMSKTYWINLGYSEEDAQQKAQSETERISKAMHDKWDRSFNRFTVEFWIRRGYSENDARECARMANAENTKNISREIRSRATKAGRANIPREKLKKLYKEHSQYLKRIKSAHSPCFKQYWINQGYSEEDAIKQAYLTRMGGRKESGNLASKIESKFFDDLQAFLGLNILRQKWVTIGGKAYCQDGRYDNIVFEFNGTKFHLDSRFYSKIDKDPFGRTFEEVKNKDNQKKEAYAQKKYNVIVIWEYDYLNYKEELFKLIKDLVEHVIKGKISGSYWSSDSVFDQCRRQCELCDRRRCD